MYNKGLPIQSKSPKNSHPKIIDQTFDDFDKNQLKFIQNVAELAAKSTYAQSLYEKDAVETVMRLVTCVTNETIRVNAVLALSRLAEHSELSTQKIICLKTQLQQLLNQISVEKKYYKLNCMSLIENVSKHSSSNALILIKECEGVDAILLCLNDFDVDVRESALQAISSIARQDVILTTFIGNSGLLPPIVQCLKGQQQNLRLSALSALTEIAKYTQDLAQVVVDVKCLPNVISFLSESFKDVKVQKSALILTENIVRHSLFLTENVIEANLFPDIIFLMTHMDESIRYNASKVIREMVKHSVQIAQMVVNTKGISSLITVISRSEQFSCAPAVLALGFIAAMSPNFALAITQSKALIHLTAILKSCNTSSHIKVGVTWTLGMIGKHSHNHAKDIWDCGALTAMMDVFMDSSLEKESDQLRIAIQLILNVCDDYEILERMLMLSITHSEMMTFVLDKISYILQKNSKARRNFLKNGHLKTIQDLTPEFNSELYKVIQAVNCNFPEDIVQMAAGYFPETVMGTVDNYEPKSQCLFYDREDRIRESYSSGKEPVLSGEESILKFE